MQAFLLLVQHLFVTGVAISLPHCTIQDAHHGVDGLGGWGLGGWGFYVDVGERSPHKLPAAGCRSYAVTFSS